MGEVDPAEVEPSPTRRRWPFAVAGVVAVGLIATAAVLVLSGDDGPAHPDAWDPRVEDLVAVVEEERGLEFVEPVYVDFLSEGEFRAEVTSEETELGAEDREQLEQATALLRALGLVDGDVDLFEASNQLYGGGIVGLYDPESERIVVRGDDLTPMVRSTLVHELTHALQDQHFDIAREFDEGDDDAASAFQAVVEGDASRVETAYREGSPEEEQEELAEEEADAADDFEGELDDVPDFLVASLGAPYALGEGFLLLVEEDGGGVDDLFAVDAGLTMEHLYDPWSYLEGDEPLDVPVPEVDGDVEVVEEGSFGVLGWYFVLAMRLEPADAMEAADGWAGDAYVSFERDGVTCARATFRGDRRTDARQMGDALEAWIDASPDSDASVARDGDLVTFESCDPGDETEVANPSGASDALALAATRTHLASTLVGEGAPEDVARCYTAGVIERFSLEEITDPDAAVVNSTDGQAELADIAADCA